MHTLQHKHISHTEHLKYNYELELIEKTQQIQGENNELRINLKAAESKIEQWENMKTVSADTRETVFLKKEIASLKEDLAKRLKAEHNFNETLFQKDTQIQELLDYKKQWGSAKFA